jgi:cytochrome c-type biogenesis protein
MDFLHFILQSSTFPALTAFILGLMTTISPCPLCTNVTAIGYLSKDVRSKRQIIQNGLMYSLGKIIAFTALAAVFVLGGSVLPTQHFFETYGEMLLGPFLIIGGLFMLEFFKFHKHTSDHHSSESFSDKIINKSVAGSARWSLILGIIFSLAFCPYSGVLYFGGLIPLTLAHSFGLIYAVVFAIGTSLPVLLISWVLAYSISGIGSFYDKIQVFETWFRRSTAVVFILMGIYVMVEYFSHFGHAHIH